MRCDSQGRNVSAMPTPTGKPVRGKGCYHSAQPHLASDRLRRHLKLMLQKRSTGATTAARPASGPTVVRLTNVNHAVAEEGIEMTSMAVS